MQPLQNLVDSNAVKKRDPWDSKDSGRQKCYRIHADLRRDPLRSQKLIYKKIIAIPMIARTKKLTKI